MKRFTLLAITTVGTLTLASCSDRTTITAPAAREPLLASSPARSSSGVNVLLKGPITEAVVADLSKIGPVLDQISPLNALTMRATAAELDVIRAKPYVAAAEMDVEVRRGPVRSFATTDFSAGRSSWDQDAIGVTVSPGFTGRNASLGGLTGAGVYVVILDSGLLPTWREYFPSERIATQYALSFGGGGGDVGTVSSQPEKWEQDTDSHGTHVTSTVLGFQFPTGPVNGTAPGATVIPVKVLNQNGSGWWSVISRGIVYAADLKTGELGGSPVVVNMSIGGGRSLLLERALDYAIARGVIIVAAAGNEGNAGMSWPGAYAPVISVAAYGWTRQWLSCDSQPLRIVNTWWSQCDVADPTRAGDFFIADFSSRELAGQQLDVSAPGEMVVGAYQINNGPLGWFFLSGTSMASPHVAGIAALMAEKNRSLTQGEVEAILKGTAIRMAAGSKVVFDINAGRFVTETWGANATGSGMVDAVAAINGLGGTKKRR
jgi:subtilisin family serine protease